jgi:hypothetical protein
MSHIHSTQVTQNSPSPSLNFRQPMHTQILTVLWNRNYLLRFRFRFWLLKSYGSGSGSNFWKVMVPVPVSTFEKVTVPVPAPYLDHKKQIFQKKFLEISLTFYWVSCFTRKKLINFNKFMIKCEWKKYLIKEIKYIILCLVPVPEP